LVSNLIYNLPKSLQRRDFHTLQVPPLEGFREVKVDKRQNEMHPEFSGASHFVALYNLGKVEFE
jgi:hypothetical protein